MPEPAREGGVSGTNTRWEPRNGPGAYQRAFDPQKAVKTLYTRLGSWRKVAAELGGAYSPACWYLIAQGQRPSRQAENALRRYVGLAPRGVTRLWAMSVADLRWYLAHRRRVTYGDGRED